LTPIEAPMSFLTIKLFGNTAFFKLGSESELFEQPEKYIKLEKMKR
jgi:hypothetical protein